MSESRIPLRRLAIVAVRATFLRGTPADKRAWLYQHYPDVAADLAVRDSTEKETA